MDIKLFDLPISYLIDPRERLFWGYLLSAAVIAVLITYRQTRKLPTRQGWKDYWLHPSALLDYKYFFVIWLLKVYLIAPLLFSAQKVAIWTFRFTRDYLAPVDTLSYETVSVLYTLTLFVVSDFTRYWLHRALHGFDFLWTFHKVHHSAEVLTPVTFYRIHPVESFLFGLRYALTAGIVTGVFMTLFGAKLSVNQILGVNVFIFTFSVLGSNLRHSHVYLRFPKWLESVFISPAQHQLHHQYRSSRKNYGGYLAVWDACFGTIEKSHNQPKPKRFGIANSEMPNFNSLSKLLFTPLKDIFKK